MIIDDLSTPYSCKDLYIVIFNLAFDNEDSPGHN
jgi:hypothetical protein